MAWVLFAIIIAAFVIDEWALTSFLALVEGALLFIIFIFVFFALYRAAQVDRDTKIERNELTSILGTLDDAIIVYEEGFRAIFFNPAAERLFRVRAKTIFGHVFVPQDVEKEGWRTLIQVIFPSLAPRVIARSREGEYPQVLDLSFTDPQIELRVTSAPITDDNGTPLAFMKIIRDRTTQITAMHSKSEFVTVASHQLRGPVIDINWALESLEKASGLSDTDKGIVENALAASRGMVRRIEDLLNIAKMEEGQFGYSFAETDPVDFVGKILTDTLPAARKTGVKVYFDRPAANLPQVMIDPKRLSLALTNILENAIRYNVENGEVVVKVDVMQQKPFIEVTVKDSGIGVPPEAMEKLFNKFYRADNAMKAQTEGSGLGLYITRSIINAHGGEIWIESELNRGTTVHFTIPTDPSLVPKHEVNSEYFL